jgi:hypothetical protein
MRGHAVSEHEASGPFPVDEPPAPAATVTAEDVEQLLLVPPNRLQELRVRFGPGCDGQTAVDLT